MTSVQPQPQAETSYRAGLASTRSADPFEGLEQAGWSDTDRIKVGDGPFQTLSWGNLRTLLAAYREKLGRCFTVAPDAAMRNAWMGEPLPYDGSTIRSAKVDSPIRLAEPEPDVAFRVLLLGDTGDASQAQAAVARQVTGRGRNVGACLQATDVAAVLIESDLVYPAGAGGEYVDKFFRPYAELLDSQVPIYAVPGNHDWNDGSLIGFMSTFCGVADVPESVRAARSTAIKSRYKALLKIWRNGSAAPTGRPSPSGDDPDKRQPGPYYALDVGGALFIGIDTGYADTIDIEQARWLVRMVERRPEMPKVLFSGKPLIVNGLRAPCRFTGVTADSSLDVESTVEKDLWYTSVDDVVRRPENGFVAVIGGDVHNYQRYVAHLTPSDASTDERKLPYVVCGGGGVFIGQTSWLDPVAIDESKDARPDHVRCCEHETVLFPQRAHSRLFLQAIVRRSVGHARFTLPIAVVVAGLVTVIAAAVDAVVRGFVHAPHGWAGVGLLFIAAAVNVSARPITWKGGLLSLGFGAVAAVLIRCPDTPQGLGSLTRHETAGVMIGALLLGLIFLLAGSISNPPQFIRVGLSFLGTIMVGAASLTILLLSVPRDWRFGAVAVLILAASFAAFAYVTEIFRHDLTVEDAFREQPERLSVALAKRQRAFSIYETFTDGRLCHHRRLTYQGRPVEVKLPLYRSFLEIEHRRDKAGRWTFAFTAFAVTGEDNWDASPGSRNAPRVADAFEVHWTPGGPLEFAITPAPAGSPPRADADRRDGTATARRAARGLRRALRGVLRRA